MKTITIHDVGTDPRDYAILRRYSGRISISRHSINSFRVTTLSQGPSQSIEMELPGEHPVLLSSQPVLFE